MEVILLVRDAGELIVVFSATHRSWSLLWRSCRLCVTLGSRSWCSAPQIMEFIVEFMPLVRDAGEQIVVFSATHRSWFIVEVIQLCVTLGSRSWCSAPQIMGIYCGGHSACA